MKPNYSLKEATPQLSLGKPKPIIIGKHKYSGIWFNHNTKKEVGCKIESTQITETGRKFKCVETRMILASELVDTSKYSNKKMIYISYADYPQKFGPGSKAKAEIWMLVNE
jgi:hypothetical protein